MAEFMLFIRGGDEGVEEMTSEQRRQRVQKYIDWSARLRAEGRNRGANELAGDGVVLSGNPGSIVVDGPFAETKEAIGGYFLIEAADKDEAVGVARGCPALGYGGSVEVRPIVDHG